MRRHIKKSDNWIPKMHPLCFSEPDDLLRLTTIYLGTRQITRTSHLTIFRCKSVCSRPRTSFSFLFQKLSSPIYLWRIVLHVTFEGISCISAGDSAADCVAQPRYSVKNKNYCSIRFVRLHSSVFRFWTEGCGLWCRTK